MRAFLALAMLVVVPAAAAGVNDPDDLPIVDAMLARNAHDFTQANVEDIFTYSGVVALPSGRRVHILTTLDTDMQFFCEKPSGRMDGVSVGSRVHMGGNVMLNVQANLFVLKTCAIKSCPVGSIFHCSQ